ncbi:hypothetical protein MHYP_G00277170 [Metynnis hypsauchen]
MFSRFNSFVSLSFQEITMISKPAVLVVLHHTFDPERTVSDSSRDVNRPNTLTVDCLFHEDRGLLQCRKNDEALGDVAAWLKHVVKYQSFQPFAVQTERGDAAWGETSRTDNLPQLKLRLGKLNFVKCVTGKTLGSHMDFVRILCKRRAELQEVHAVEECDVILAFCPVVSVAGIDTKNALEQLNDVSGSKPAVLVVLHHTFDPELIVPDSSRSVNREETLTVDCLFHEDKGLLRCRKNDEALSRVSEWIETQGSYYQ